MSEKSFHKEKKLTEWFQHKARVLVALSGGVDSCLVAYAARRFLGKENAISLIGVSSSLKKRDLELAKDFCRENDIKLVEVEPNEIDNPDYRGNPVNRCFFCKSELYREMKQFRDEHYPDYLLVNGNNKSDWSDYRPGLKAADDFTVYSPLADCGFEKDDIRRLANKYGLTVWDKPASPCLSSRLPYGENITEEKLSMVEKAENLLNDFGFMEVRVRYINNSARIEVPSNQIKVLSEKFFEIEPRLLEFGFKGSEIDQEGLVSGKLNRAIKK